MEVGIYASTTQALGGVRRIKRKKFAETTTRTGTVYIASALVLPTSVPASIHVQAKCSMHPHFAVVPSYTVIRIYFYFNQQCIIYFFILTIFILLSLQHVSIHLYRPPRVPKLYFVKVTQFVYCVLLVEIKTILAVC